MIQTKPCRLWLSATREYPLLRLIHDLLDGALSLVVHVPDDVGRGVDEPPKQRLVTDDPGMVIDVRRRRDRVEKFGEVRRAARRFDLIGVLELFIERDDVDHVPALKKAHHTSEKTAVGLPVEHGVVDDLDRFCDRIVVDEHAAEDRELGLQRVRRLPIVFGQRGRD